MDMAATIGASAKFVIVDIVNQPVSADQRGLCTHHDTIVVEFGSIGVARQASAA
jgi:hypothetical protein